VVANLVDTVCDFDLNKKLVIIPNNEQDTQLSLTNRATRLEVTKHGTIPHVRYGFLFVWYSNFVP